MCPRFVRFGPRSVPVVREGAETDEDGVHLDGYYYGKNLSKVQRGNILVSCGRIQNFSGFWFLNQALATWLRPFSLA